MAENLTFQDASEKTNGKPRLSGKNIMDINIETITCQSETELTAWVKNSSGDTRGNKRSVLTSLPAYVPARFQSSSQSTIALLDLSKLTSTIEHSTEDKVIKVQAGMTKSQLDEILSKTNEWWPCHAANDKSLAEIIGTGDGGTLEHHFGGPKHLVLGLDILLANGDVIKTGGRVVKNVTGYDLSKLFVGSHGSLGIVLAAYLRLFAKPEQTCTLKLETNEYDKLFVLCRTLMGLGLDISSLEIISSQLFEKLQNPESQNSNNSSSGVLLVELHGQAKEIEEVQEKIAEKLKETFAQATLQTVEQSVFPQLTRADETTGRHALEISCAQSQMDKIIAFISQRIYGLYWQARPGRSRLKFFAHDLDVLSETAKALSQWAQENGESLVVASPDHEFSLRVRTLPTQDAQAFALKLALKSRFDPDNILNPLVCL